MAEKREIEITLRSRSAEANANKLNRAVKGVGQSADTAETSMSKLSAVATAVASSLVVTKVIQYADAWTNVNNRLRAATNTAREFALAQQGVTAIAQEAAVDISGVADSYSRIAQSTAELGISQERVLDVTRKVTLALKAGGATAAEASSVLVQFGQGLGSGALQGDELRSILEASIPITKALAKEFDATTGELKQLGAEGKLTADRVISAIENMDAKALTFTKDISSGFTEISNALTVYIGELDDATGASQSMYNALSDIASNMDLVFGATELFIKLGIASYILKGSTAMAAYVGGLSAATTATNALTVASRSLKFALPFGIILGGLEVMHRMLTATNDQISANDRYSASIKKLNARLSTKQEIENANALRIAAEDNLNKQARLQEEKNKLRELEVKLEKANAANLAKLRGEQYDEEDRLTLFQITKTQNRIKLAEDELKRYQAIADKARARFLEAQNAIGGQASKSEVMGPKIQFEGSAGDRQKQADQLSSGADSSFIEKLKLETAAIAAENEVRRQLRDGEITEIQASRAIELQNLLFSYEERRQAILEQEFQTETLRQEALAELRNQELEQIKAFEANKTEVKADGDNQRMMLEKMYSDQVMAMQMNVASQGINVLRGFVGQSKTAKIALLALDKGLAIAQTFINSQVAATRALAELGPIAGPPVATKMLAYGKISAGLIAASGIAEAFSGGGGGGSVSAAPASSFSGGSASQPAPQVQAQSQQRVVNITGLENFGPDDLLPLTRSQFEQFVSTDENVNIAINTGQGNAARTGAI